MIIFFLGAQHLLAQDLDSLRAVHRELDSLFIYEVERKPTSTKVLHAEPLYIDLIRDLGARKGEQEWNLGLGLTDNLRYDTYQTLIEYEWAPVNRLGLEVEIPLIIIAPYKNGNDSIPSSRMESLKTAGQWSFFVSERLKTSMAVGYINEFEFSDLDNFGKSFMRGNIFNPFFVVAKRWGNNYHTLIYTGPRIEREFKSKAWHSRYDINTSFHYMISGTRNFIGVEINKTIQSSGFDAVVRPQMRVGIAPNFLIGILGGVPLNRDNQRFSMFMRLIWEPGNVKH
ncbi:MAG TPA: HAEPLYID family protein [Cyclobacteriaceae bacterium]|nr:HAEPLYID family protein [Cyclobacteriaceae bacterium]HRF33991.1 HAEPLYID family protein [Cyclobacteriaceae bacterium]